MPGIDAIILARIQFAFTMGFHIIFPAFTIGLANFLVVLEGLWLKTGQQVYLDLFRYWVKIFSIGFAMGVVSGLPMEYQFGTNWGGLSDRAGSIIGPLLGYEVLMAFFLEAGFLGVMLFGMGRVGPYLHFMATCLVALGTFFSAFWILAANSWMQTPQGYTIATDGRFLPASWLEIVFNPSFPYRLVHMILATFISVAFMVGAVGAVHLLRDNRNAASRTMFSMAMWMAALVTPVQIIAGDMHGLNTLQYQPAKIAAMEGVWDTASQNTGEPLILFGIPDMQIESNHYEVALPRLGSLILTHSWDGVIQGLKTFAPENRPYVPLVFFAFRIMVALGFLMFAVGLVGLYLRWKRRLYSNELFLRLATCMAPAGYIALLAGWTVTEAGRQPFTVYGLMRTSESASPIGAPGVAISLAGFAVVYLIVYTAGALFLLRLMAKPPLPGETGPPPLPTRSAGITPGPAGAGHGN